MAKKFIRHLEFYGFPDQNTYESEMGGGCNVDLSEIIKKNNEQDKEIKELSDEKASKKELDSLSNTVEDMINLQSEINQGFADSISANTAQIEVITEKVNEIGDTLNDVVEDVQELNDKVDGIEQTVEQLSGAVDTLSAQTSGITEAIEEMAEELEEKLDKTEAEETYAKKEDVYTKEEIDTKLESYATKDWIEETGYITQDEADARYAKKETVEALSDRVNSAVTDLNTKIYTVSGDLASFSSSTNARMGILETNFETLRGEVNRKVNEISGSVNTLSGKVETNANDIDALEDEMARKANQADLERLQNTVSNLSDLVDTKVGKPEFENYKTIVANKFNDMDDKKADKSAFTEAMDAIQDVNDRLDQEIADRIAGDEALQNQIDALDGEMEQLSEEVESYDDRITAVETGLTKEIADRIQADLDLIGHETDDKDDDTIWAAKNFAKNQKRQAVAEANAYTDGKVTEINSRIDQEHEWAEQNFSSAASKAYVESMVNDLEDELETEITNAVNEETDRATAAEEDLLRRIIEVLRALGENDRLLDLLTNRVNAITAWDGTDPSEYDNTGNGVLDVLHREFHEFEQTAGSIKEIRVEDGNLIIVYYTKEGEKEAVIPVADLIDLSNYYTKEETDEKIEEAVSGLVLDYYTKEETDAKIAEAVSDVDDKIAGKVDTSAFTEAVDELNDKISANTADIQALEDAIAAETERATSAETELEESISATTSALDALINRLGYTDNETLHRNGEHEVAFGQYNISNTSEDASGKTIFSVGNGTDDANRSNAIEIRENGDIYMWVEGDFMNVNKLLGQIAHEVYDTDGTHNSHFFDGN